MGLRYVLPDLIEEEVIDVKDSLIQNGLKEGLKTAVENTINIGKSAIGIVTGNFENISGFPARRAESFAENYGSGAAGYHRRHRPGNVRLTDYTGRKAGGCRDPRFGK